MIIFLCIFRCAGDGSFKLPFPAHFLLRKHVQITRGDASIAVLSTATEAAIAIILSALYLIGWIAAIRDFIKEKTTTEEEKREARIKILEDFLAKLHEEDNPA